MSCLLPEMSSYANLKSRSSSALVTLCWRDFMNSLSSLTSVSHSLTIFDSSRSRILQRAFVLIRSCSKLCFSESVVFLNDRF